MLRCCLFTKPIPKNSPIDPFFVTVILPNLETNF